MYLRGCRSDTFLGLLILFAPIAVLVVLLIW
jgi:hypothetical protein